MAPVRNWIRMLLIIAGLFAGWLTLSILTYDYTPDHIYSSE